MNVLLRPSYVSVQTSGRLNVKKRYVFSMLIIHYLTANTNYNTLFIPKVGTANRGNIILEHDITGN